MNKETNELIEKLAQKMGTTTEYLWSVLIKQAQIDAWTSIFQYLLIVIFGIILYRLHKKFSFEPEGHNSYSMYYDKDYLGYLMGISAAIFAILAVCAFFSITDTVNGFLNPEYWALRRVLDAI